MSSATAKAVRSSWSSPRAKRRLQRLTGSLGCLSEAVWLLGGRAYDAELFLEGSARQRKSVRPSERKQRWTRGRYDNRQDKRRIRFKLMFCRLMEVCGNPPDCCPDDFFSAIALVATVSCCCSTSPSQTFFAGPSASSQVQMSALGEAPRRYVSQFTSLKHRCSKSDLLMQDSWKERLR